VALAALAGAVLTVGLALLALTVVAYIRIRLSAPNQPSPVSTPLVAALIVLGACGGGLLWMRIADFATGRRSSVYRGLLPRIILLAGVASWQWFAYSIGLGGALALILCVGALDGLVLYLQRRQL
jgi:hypothetical protein